MSKRKYRVDLGGLEKKNFGLGGGSNLTLLDGTVLIEGHKFIKLFPTFVKEVTDVSKEEITETQLLVEEPIADAKVEVIIDEPIEEVIDDESISSMIEAFKTKDALVAYAQDEFEIKLAKNKSLKDMKSTLLSKIEG